jgi:hypothetical protein
MASIGWGKRGASRAGFLAIAAWLLLASTPSVAQTRNEFWGELDAYIKLGHRLQLFLLAGSERDSDSTTSRDVQLGAALDITLKPILRSKRLNPLIKGDWERERYFWARVGYRYKTTVGNVDSPSHENRGIIEVTGRVPLPRDFWMVHRGHVDLRDVNGSYSTRYRYRLLFERKMHLFRVVTAPYVSGEIYYDTRYDTVSQHQYRAGVEVVLSKRWRIEPYFARQDNERSQPPHVNALGLKLKYYH